MTLTTQATTVLIADEDALGEDKIQKTYDAAYAAAAGTITDKVTAGRAAIAQYAVEILDFTSDDSTEFDEETELGAGDQSLSPATPTQQNGGCSGGMRMRASGGVAGRVPTWFSLLPSCGYQRRTDAGYELTGCVIDTSLNANPIATAANAKQFALLQLGERVNGTVAVTGASTLWEDAEFTGAGTPATGDPTKGDAVVIYPVGGSADNPVATGKIAEDLTGSTLFVRLDANETGAPLSGMNVRVDLDGLGDYAYNTLAADMPLAFVTLWQNTEAASADSSTLYLYLAQGSLTSERLVGQVSGVIVDGYSAALHGEIAQPDSRARVRINTTGGGWSAGMPGVGTILQRLDNLSNVIAAGVVIESGTTYAIVSPFTLFGAFEDAGALLGFTDGAAATTAVQSGAVVGIGLTSKSIHHIVDGYRKRHLGQRGNASIELASGSVGRVSFTFEGGAGVDPDSIGPVPVSLQQWTAPRFEGGVAEVDGLRLELSSFNFDLAPQITRRTSANAAGGVLGASSATRQPTAQISAKKLGTLDGWEAKRRNAGVCRGGAVVGKTKNNRFSIIGTRLQVTSVSDADESGAVQSTVDFRANRVQGDDEIIIHLM